MRLHCFGARDLNDLARVLRFGLTLIEQRAYLGAARSARAAMSSDSMYADLQRQRQVPLVEKVWSRDAHWLVAALLVRQKGSGYLHWSADYSLQCER